MQNIFLGMHSHSIGIWNMTLCYGMLRVEEWLLMIDFNDDKDFGSVSGLYETFR